VIGHKSVVVILLAEAFYKREHFNIEHLVKIAFILNVDMCEFLNFE